MIAVDVLVLRGAMASSVALTFDVLATANRLRVSSGRPALFRVRACGSGARALAALAGEARAVVGAGAAKIVIVPGLGMSSEADITARMAQRDAVAAVRKLRDAAGRGAELCTSCSGTFMFAHAGLLDGRRATTTWWLAPLFRKLHPRVRLQTDALVVQDGPVTTAGAALAQMDLMLAIVARHGGARLAGHCARYLLLDERHSQSRYMALGHLAATDERIARAETCARERMEKGVDVADLAAAAGLSVRTFARHVERATGMSPVKFLQRLRVERATELLETSRMSLDEIARRVGYAEPSTLRRLIRRDRGEAPRKLRTPARRRA